jgi:hypothetical protein
MIGPHARAVVPKDCAQYDADLPLAKVKKETCFVPFSDNYSQGLFKFAKGIFFFKSYWRHCLTAARRVFLARTKPVVHVDDSTQGCPRYMVNILPERRPEYERQWGLVERENATLQVEHGLDNELFRHIAKTDCYPPLQFYLFYKSV